jgi:hypothetical protein
MWSLKSPQEHKTAGSNPALKRLVLKKKILFPNWQRLACLIIEAFFTP